ncbi:MAG: hypothetical protein JXB34_10640 [Bacteroidales bacterium]|nr:hypothetical protein [Bacteroidales bacterium]
MKKLSPILSFFLSLNAFAQEGKFGLGIIVGEPTGLSAKVWTSQTNAFDAALAWRVNHRYGDALQLHASFLKHSFGLIDVEKGRLPFYFGIGAKVILANDPLVGVRIPLGISYIFADAPLDLFLEIVPVLNLIPSTDFDVDGGIGIRYYF